MSASITENSKTENAHESNNITPSPIPEIDETVEESKQKQLSDSFLKEFSVNIEANKNKPVAKLLSKTYVTGSIFVSNTSQYSVSNDTIKLIEGTRIIPDQICNTTTTEKLLPLINVCCSLTSNKATTLRRTYSFGHAYTKIHNKSKMFGSEESNHPSSTRSQQTRWSLLKSQKFQDCDKICNNISPSNSSVRQKSLNTLNPPLKRESAKKSPRTLNKEVSVEAKVDSVLKNNIKPRSHISTSASRLYSRSKKGTTDTNHINNYRNNIPEPKELTIYSNAKAYLRELTNKEVTAHRQKHEETQTDFGILCLKKISTDVDDIRACLAEIKYMEIENDIFASKDASVEWTILSHYLQQDKKINISFTRTCGTQSSIEIYDKNKLHNTTSREKIVSTSTIKGLSNSISFTKYLRGKHGSTFNVANAVPTNSHIYMNTVNINICPTVLQRQNSIPDKMHFAIMKMLTDHFTSVDGIIPANKNEIYYRVATSTTILKFKEKVHSIYLPNIQAPEVCLTKDIDYALCKPLPTFQLELVKPKVIQSFKCECIKLLDKPIILKSIVGQCFNNFNELLSNSEEIAFQTELPDSLDYHIANNKKVKFSVKPNEPEIQKIIKAMSKFLEETTQLIYNLSTATNNLSNHNSVLSKSYVTLNNISGLTKLKNKRHRKPESQGRDDITLPISVERADRSTQLKIDQIISVNNYEDLVEDSCIRLEEKISRNTIRQSRIHITSDKSRYNADIKYQFSEEYYNQWDYNATHSLNGIYMEDSSLDSNPVTLSDYGNLPRKIYKRYRRRTCSPSAFLRQLTNMRRQIIESSRDELLGTLNYSNNH